MTEYSPLSTSSSSRLDSPLDIHRGDGDGSSRIGALLLPRRTGSATRQERSHSASKLNRQLSEMSQKDNMPARQRHLSVRKQRRWENAHLFDLPFIPQDERNLTPPLGVDDAKEKIFTLRKDLGSVFIKLADDLELFFDPMSDKDISRKKKTPMNRRPKSPLEQAERAWTRVEKRLRLATSKVVASDKEHLNAFISALEKVLLSFKNTKKALFVGQETDYAALLDLTIEKPVCKDGHLYVALTDSPHHRLLLHATAQFVGLCSRSKDIRFSPSSSQRVCIISLPTHTSYKNERESNTENGCHVDRELVSHMPLVDFLQQRNTKIG